MSEADIILLRSRLRERRQKVESLRAPAPAPAQMLALLREIDAALERMDRGTFGRCETCHESVEEDRLMADPLVTLCLDHLNQDQRRALEQDLDMATRIQAKLLPARLTRADGWEASYHYEPAGQVSGDFCDLVSADGSLFFVTGDVSGKGVAASLLMSHLHAILRSLLSVGMPLPELLERANRLFCESTLSASYATLACGRAAGGGEIELCNAAHCPPFAVCGGRPAAVETSGLPLGMFCHGSYPAQRLQLGPGDFLFLYTDGLTEATNPQGEEYGIERLSHVLAECQGLPAAELVTTCLDDLHGFLSGGSNKDDLTIVVVCRG